MKIERLYLRTNELNNAKVLEELKNIIIAKGGHPLKNQYTDKYILSNRSIINRIMECEKRIEDLKEWSKLSPFSDKQSARDKAIQAKEKELEELKMLNNEPIELNYRSYMYFVYDGYYYYISFDDNCFNPATYCKIEINDNLSYTGNYYHDELPNYYEISKDVYSLDMNIKETTTLLFDTLINSKPSQKYRDGKKVRVPNYYDGGYHYEMKYEPEKTHTIDKALFL